MVATKLVCAACGTDRVPPWREGVDGFPTLCQRCYDRSGRRLKPEDRVLDTIGGTRGTVRGYENDDPDDHVVIVDLDGGGEAYWPTALTTKINRK